MTTTQAQPAKPELTLEKSSFPQHEWGKTFGGCPSCGKVTCIARSCTQPVITGCTEQGFMIDSASANELVAYDYAASTLCSAVLRILDGERNGFESQNEPWATVRNRLLEVMKPALQPTTHNGTGMELRDYFAAKAMQGMLANPKLQAQIIKVGQSWIEESAWAVADAMLKAR